MEAYNERGAVIPHGPGSLYNSREQFKQGMFKFGRLDGLGRTIYSQHGWHQGEYSYGRYHGAGVCCRGQEIRKLPVTTINFIEVGIWDNFFRQGTFDFITPKQEC